MSKAKANLAGRFLQNLPGSMSAALPGSALNALFGGLTAGPLGAVAYGLGDLALNTPAIALARGIKAPKVGDFYIFPYDVEHCVYPFKGEGNRRSMSINFDVNLVKKGFKKIQKENYYLREV